MYYDDATHGGARIGLSSVVLLIIFVSAFAVMVAAAVWRPWAEEDTPTTLNPPAEIQVDPNAVPGAIVPPEGAAPVVDGQAAAP